MPKGGIRPYQLLDACARSPTVRRRYIELVNNGAERVAGLLAEGQREGIIRRDLGAQNGGTLVLALVVGLQTLADLGIELPLPVLAAEVLKLLTRTSPT